MYTNRDSVKPVYMACLNHDYKTKIQNIKVIGYVEVRAYRLAL
jgi:hypothetical protein